METKFTNLECIHMKFRVARNQLSYTSGCQHENLSWTNGYRQARVGVRGVRESGSVKSLPPSRAQESGDTTPCRMTGVTLHSHVHYKEIYARTYSGLPPEGATARPRKWLQRSAYLARYRGSSLIRKRLSPLGPPRGT